MATRLSKITLVLLMVALVMASGWFTSQAHHAVLRFNLEEMEATADRIFLGRCLAVEKTDEMVAGGMMPVTHYTFEVERALKGKFQKKIKFSQLGHPAQTAKAKGNAITMHGQVVSTSEFIHGMAEYQVGERAVLFLIPDYMDGKFTYPVGLYQGAFMISEMPSGNTLVRNSINNQELFTAPYNNWKMKRDDAKVVFPERDEPLINSGGGISTQSVNADKETLTNKRGALPLDAFLNVVAEIVSAHGSEKGVITQ
ncbi:MAG: hypothetical protein HY231_26195 [Acidobacteria bacterium]|nr:hypothetical protein [Acidobacteriota bacterium]